MLVLRKSRNGAGTCQRHCPLHHIGYTGDMRYQSLLLMIVLLSACAEEDPPALPSFPAPLQDGGTTSGDTTEPTDVLDEPVEDVSGELGDGDAQQEPTPDVEPAPDTVLDPDAANPDTEVDTAPEPDATEPDTAVDTTDPEDTEPEDTQEPEEEDGETPDATPGDDTADTEEPGECLTDEDCQVLTKKECCPFFTPCTPLPEVGTLEDEVANLAWIQTECPLVESCPDLVPAECNTCHNIYAYAPVCDKDLGECVVDSEVDCTAVCAAASTTDICPVVSHPELLTEELIVECGCL